MSATRFPVSIKGVVISPADQVVLLRNERDEWELPGGKLEPGEAPSACVEREILEELGLVVRAGPVLDCWLYEVVPSIEVLIVSYGCHAEPFGRPTHSPEHRGVGLFHCDSLGKLPMPDGYRRAVALWRERLAGGAGPR